MNPQRDDNSYFDFGALFRVLIRHWPTILAITVGALVASAFYLSNVTRVYRASATLQIDPHALRPLGSEIQTPGDSSNFYWTNQEYYQTQYRIIASRKLAERVVQTLNLHKDQGFLEMSPPGKGSKGTGAVTVTRAGQILSDRISVEPVEGSRLVAVSLSDSDPARAQRIVNVLTEAYIDQNLDTSLTNIGDASDWLHDQLTKLKGELESNELALHEYKKEKQLLSVSLDDKTNMLQSEMEQLHQSLTDARTEREKLNARVEQLKRVDANEPTNLPSSELLTNEALSALREKYIEARSEVEKLRSGGKGEEHPDVKRARAMMDNTRSALVTEVRNVQEAFERDLSAVNRQITGISSLYKEAEQEAFDLNLNEIEYKRLARAKENTERLHSLVLERAKESELGSQMRFNNVSVMEAALLPSVPHSPRVGLILGSGAGLGLLLGLGFVLLRQQLRQRIETPEDIEEGLGSTCLGVIPEMESDSDSAASSGGRVLRRRSRRAPAGAELFVHRNPNSTAAEAMRALRTNLLFMSPDRPHQRILVTSAGPTDGKTTIAASLAIALSHSGQRVLLIDSDLRKPRLSALLGNGAGATGVTSAIFDLASLSEAIVQTEVEGMMFLPSGPIPPNPSELLHSERYKQMLNRVSEMFDRIIIDSPPLLPVTDAAILSTNVDGTLLVVRSGETRRQHARQALRALADVNANVVGAVLNGARIGAGSGYYYYRYNTYGAPPDQKEISQTA